MNPRPRRLNPCHRHPNLPTTTRLCAPCLHHRLSLLSPPSPAVAVLPELRRCRSFSANTSAGLSLDPRRRSCDVWGTLSTLFHVDDDVGNVGDLGPPVKVESRNLSLLGKGSCPLSEEQEQEDENEPGIDCEIRVCEMREIDNVDRVCYVDEFEEGKTIKEFIDIECQANTSKTSNRKDFKEIAGSFWVAASVLSKKLQRWRKKEGSRRHSSVINDADGHRVGLGEMRLDRLRGRRLRDTQSEVGEFRRRSCDVDLGRASMDVDAFGRRSCDSDPRFSIDLGRASIDCGRISVDEGKCSLDAAPRASWDGYLIGGRTLSCRATPIVSVIENAMAAVYGFDHRILVQGKTKVENRVEKEQYLDNYVHLYDQRKSTDQHGFLKKDVAEPLTSTLALEDEKPNLLSNAKVSPAAVDMFDRSKLLISEKELNNWRLNSLKDDSSESFETSSKDFASVSSGSNCKVFKKCRQWRKLWNVWGLLNPRKGEKHGHKERLERGKPEYPHPESSYNSGSNGDGAPRFDPTPKLVRSHSAYSSRKKKESVFERNNSSSRYSPNVVENGLLRFYLAPSRSRRQTKPGKTKLKKSNSLARSVLRL